MSVCKVGDAEILDSEPRKQERIPPLGDARHPPAQVGEGYLSQCAIDNRLKRLMKPKGNGAAKVSDDIVKMFRSGPKGKKKVEAMFAAAGYDRDRGVKTGPFVQCVFQYIRFCCSQRKSFVCSWQETFIVECEALLEEFEETNLIVEGEYISKKDMMESWGWSETPGLNTVPCA